MFEVGQLLENLFRRQAGRQEIEHVCDADAQPSNARATAALSGIDGDAVSENSVRVQTDYICADGPEAAVIAPGSGGPSGGWPRLEEESDLLIRTSWLRGLERLRRAA